LSTFGVFVELEEGVNGLIHISDLSWQKKIKHPSEFCKVGEQMESIVLKIDRENRRISLGIKQLEENPWDAFESTFTKGSIHEGTVIKLIGNAGIISMPNDVEAYCPAKHMVKVDDSSVVENEKIKFKVLEFNKDAHKIVVSHTLTFLDELNYIKHKIDDLKDQSFQKKQIKKAKKKNEQSKIIPLETISKASSITPKTIILKNTKESWQQEIHSINIGDKIECEIIDVKQYGLFVKLKNGLIGLIKKSQVRQDYSPTAEIGVFYSYDISVRINTCPGETIKAVVTNINHEQMRLNLSSKKLLEEDKHQHILNHFQAPDEELVQVIQIVSRKYNLVKTNSKYYYNLVKVPPNIKKGDEIVIERSQNGKAFFKRRNQSQNTKKNGRNS